MKQVLITGATGNVGQAIVQYLSVINPDTKIVIGTHNLTNTKRIFDDFSEFFNTIDKL